jgi:hypothetical protein
MHPAIPHPRRSQIRPRASTDSIGRRRSRRQLTPLIVHQFGDWDHLSKPEVRRPRIQWEPCALSDE